MKEQDDIILTGRRYMYTEPTTNIKYPTCVKCGGQMTTIDFTTTCDNCGKVVEHN